MKDCRHKLTWQVRPQGAWADCNKCEMRVLDLPNQVFREIVRIGMNERSEVVANTLKELLGGTPS